MTSITEFSIMVTVDMGRLMPVPRQAQRIDCLETTARMMPAKPTAMMMAVAILVAAGAAFVR